MKLAYRVPFFVATLLALSTLAGCSGSLLRTTAAADLQCPRDAVSLSDMQMYTSRASGCGKKNWYVYDGKKWISVLDRASFDLSCPVDQLTGVELGQASVGVSGCGQRAAYVRIMSEWVQNGANAQRGESR